MYVCVCGLCDCLAHTLGAVGKEVAGGAQLTGTQLVSGCRPVVLGTVVCWDV